MQNFLLTLLILGFAIILYLIGNGEIDLKDFGLKGNKNEGSFSLKVNKINRQQNDTSLHLEIQGKEFPLFEFKGGEFSHIVKNEYYKYKIPYEATDAVTGIWLGTRYTFYVKSEYTEKEAKIPLYSVYKSETLVDSSEKSDFILYKKIDGFNLTNKVEFSY